MPQDTRIPAASLEQPVDVLVVGGGPCGTAAAFRSTELGATVLVIERDDVLSRIRDYTKAKLILPSFGGADKQKFPAGGELIRLLEFEPSDKDEMCERWKGFYKDHGVPYLVGMELTGLERAANGTWIAKCWEHRERADRVFHAKHVVLAMGRGVPRRFDIPGNVEGIAFRLDDPTNYLGSPICIVGGGTSAAEAVIAISNAKADAEDRSTIHWCYRDDKMPLVSKALADVFFEAHLMNGNIRFQPNSEPTAVITAPDKSEYFVIRVDRRVMPGRPAESTHLEFPRQHCIACIGEDIPVKLLKTVGIEMITGGARNKKCLAVSPFRETPLENVYMVGAIMSPTYFRPDSLVADPASFPEVNRLDNIKNALTDGVYVAEVVHQRLEGQAQVEVRVQEAPVRVSVTKTSPQIQALG